MTPSVAPQPSQSHSQSASALMEGLRPPLRNALNSLNINLDYELARYRYAKRGEPQPTMQPPQFQPRRRSLDLINVPSPPARQSPVPAPTAATAPPPLPPNPRIQQPFEPGGDTTGTASVSSSGQPTSEVAALRSAIVHQPGIQDSSYSRSSETLGASYVHGPSYPSPPREYQPTSQAQDWTTALSTPLGLGALMLLLVASAGLGFLLINPYAAHTLLSNTPFARLLPSSETEESAASSEAPSDDTEGTADFDGPPLTPLSPDLSQREFSNLDLDTLTSVPSTSRPTGEAPVLGGEAADSPTSASDRTNSAAATATRPPSAAQTEVNTIPRRVTPAPQPAPQSAPAIPTNESPAPASQPAPPVAEPVTQPAPPASAPTAIENESATSETPVISDTPDPNRAPVSTYYVVTDYTGDPSLESVREVVDGAYVRNFDTGARIQLGAFNTSEGAAALVEELQQQGLNVDILEP
jgi:hypothetical protein